MLKPIKQLENSHLWGRCFLGMRYGKCGAMQHTLTFNLAPTMLSKKKAVRLAQWCCHLAGHGRHLGELWIIDVNDYIKPHQNSRRSPVDLLCIFFVMVERYHVSRFIGTPRHLFFRWGTGMNYEEFLECHKRPGCSWNSPCQFVTLSTHKQVNGIRAV